MGLKGRERAWPNELSGGEAQRAALARSLVREPELLLADEPFGALDALTRIRMHALLRELWERHRPSVLLVTHDVDEAIVLADRVLVLEEGRIGLDLTIDRPHPRSYRDPLLGSTGSGCWRAGGDRGRRVNAGVSPPPPLPVPSLGLRPRPRPRAPAPWTPASASASSTPPPTCPDQGPPCPDSST